MSDEERVRRFLLELENHPDIGGMPELEYIKMALLFFPAVKVVALLEHLVAIWKASGEEVAA